MVAIWFAMYKLQIHRRLGRQSGGSVKAEESSRESVREFAKESERFGESESEILKITIKSHKNQRTREPGKMRFDRGAGEFWLQIVQRKVRQSFAKALNIGKRKLKLSEEKLSAEPSNRSKGIVGYKSLVRMQKSLSGKCFT